MLTVIVMLNVQPETEFEVLYNLKYIPEVKSAYVWYGIYDVVVKLEV